MSRVGPAKTATSSRDRKPLLRKSSSVRAISRPPVGVFWSRGEQRRFGILMLAEVDGVCVWRV